MHSGSDVRTGCNSAAGRVGTNASSSACNTHASLAVTERTHHVMPFMMSGRDEDRLQSKGRPGAKPARQCPQTLNRRVGGDRLKSVLILKTKL
jgi:hypothetical protein